MNKLKKASGKLVGSTTKTTKKVVAAPTVLIGDEVANFSESISSKGSRVRYPPETQKLYSDKIIKVFDLPKNTPMKLRLIAPCQAYSEKTKQFETGELVITRKSIAFIGDNEENSRALKRNEIKSCKEGKKESEPQLKVNFKGKQKPFKMQGMTPTNAKRARKLIGHLVKEKDSKKGSTLLSLSGPLGFGKKKKKHEESKSEKPDDDDDSDSSSGLVPPQFSPNVNVPLGLRSSNPHVPLKKELPIKEGFLTKKGHKRRNWKVRYFVLEKNLLSYYKSPQDYLAKRKPKGSIILQRSTMVRVAPEMKRSNCFTVSGGLGLLYITAPTGEDMVIWMEKISAAKVKI
mmetsp:Transcript_8063/g.13534  ORF Transcript_8063/g.13534 Transcript_8063/m.13534 type:complete len:345 (+) Transcript_8063:49-1083(+)